MAGGWASALGAAILQGNRGYHEAVDQQRVVKQQTFENQRQLAADKRAQEQLDESQRMNALQEAILKKQIGDQPKTDARERLALLFQMQGNDAFNNPAAVQDAQTAGAPFQISPDFNPGQIARTRIGAIEGGAPLHPQQQLPPTIGSAASRMGVAPDTGVVLPPSARAASLSLQTQADARERLAGNKDPRMQFATDYQNATGHAAPEALLKDKQYGFHTVSNEMGGQTLYATNPDDGTAKPVKGGAGGIGSGISALNENATPDEILAKLDPKTRSMVEMLKDYKAVLPSGYAMSKPYWQNIMDITHRVDPSFDATQYPVRAAMKKDFSSGKSAVMRRSLNALVGHAAQLQQEAGALDNSRFPSWNSISNSFINQTGDPRVNNFATTATAVDDELARFLKGSGATDDQIKAWRERLRSNLSPAGFQGLFSSIGDLADTQAQSLQKQWEAGMGKPEGFAPYDDESKRALDVLRGHTSAVNNDGSGVTRSASKPAGQRAKILSITEIK